MHLFFLGGEDLLQISLLIKEYLVLYFFMSFQMSDA